MGGGAEGGAGEDAGSDLGAEVAAWAAFYSQARTAGKVPVIVMRKKYVRKPRNAPPGLAICEREQTVVVKPGEPGREAEADGYA